MVKNPFNVMFGKEPSEYVERYMQQNEIIDSFTADDPQQLIYMITGVRGSGKTVFMTTVSKRFESDSSWVVIGLNSASELLKDLAGKLYSVKGLTSKFKADGINLSLFGIGVNIKKAEPISNIETGLERMLTKLKKDNKRLLITIDEVSNTEEMKKFAGAFQLLIRQDLPVFLLMTGLYENINALQNEDNLTFLYRAPKIYLKALNIGSMAENYKRIFNIPYDKAKDMAKVTLGYPFAFQVVGFFTYENNGNYNSALPQCRHYLDEYVYDKLWSELSEKEVFILTTIVSNNCLDVKDIKEKCQLKPNQFSVYRDRLIRKGVMNGDTRGVLKFALPFFDDYIRDRI